MSFKVIVAGGRDYNNYEELKYVCDFYLKNKNVDEVEIVSGCARGADALGERYASERGIAVVRFPANWDRWGKKAGYLRNNEMYLYADALIAFWDGKSAGTKSMIRLATDGGLDVRVHAYGGFKNN